jgi:hypothetical protein
MRKIRTVSIVGALALAFSSTAPAWAGTVGEGGAAEITACGPDAAKYCNDDIMWQHEMEECLQQHINQVSKACRAQLAPFSFKKYYNEEPHLF